MGAGDMANGVTRMHGIFSGRRIASAASDRTLFTAVKGAPLARQRMLALELGAAS